MGLHIGSTSLEEQFFQGLSGSRPELTGGESERTEEAARILLSWLLPGHSLREECRGMTGKAEHSRSGSET